MVDTVLLRCTGVLLISVMGGASAGHASGPAIDQARLERCATETCVVIGGWRSDPSAAIWVAGHAVPATGRRAYRVSLPVHTVRAWSEPFARRIVVRTVSRRGEDEERAVRLPIGLLGSNTALSEIEVSAL